MLKLLLAGALALGGLTMIGCDVYSEPEPVEVGYETPVEYTYYDRGYYDGPYWTWSDRDGHRYRERREFHERRYAEHHGEHYEHYEHRR